MTLPYRWHPLGTSYSREQPRIGSLVPYEHAVYRVVAINPVPEIDWQPRDVEMVSRYPKATPKHMIIRPIGRDDRDKDLHFLLGGRAYWQHWEVYEDEHYPVCARCHEPLPCRHQMAIRTASAAIEKMSRYDTPRVCPACSEPVTFRQKSHTWAENVEIPGGPAVTFHLRGKCLGSAIRYDERWAKVTGQSAELPQTQPSTLWGTP